MKVEDIDIEVLKKTFIKIYHKGLNLYDIEQNSIYIENNKRIYFYKIPNVYVSVEFYLKEFKIKQRNKKLKLILNED